MKKRLIFICEYSTAAILTSLYSSYILLCNFKRIRKFQEVFINYRSFGHSISDTNAFLRSSETPRLCISIGNSRERNPYLPLIMPGDNMIQFILPNPKVIGRKSLRKAVGLQLFKSISILNRLGFFPALQTVVTSNKAVVLKSIQDLALDKLQLPRQDVQKTIEYIYNLDLSAREHSKSVGTWAQIYDPAEFGIKSEESPSDLKFKQALERKGVRPNKLVTLILRVGNSPHHGPGISSYEPIIEFLQSKQYMVLVLGDTSAVTSELQSLFPNLLIPSDFGVSVRSVEFSSIFYSAFTLGDMSGIWPIFTIRGRRGLCLNTIPTKFLMNRVEVLPRMWVDQKGQSMNLDRQFEVYGEKVRGENREIEIDGYRPSFHTRETMLKCVERFETELVAKLPLELDKIYLKFFPEYPKKMLRNCSIAAEFLEEISRQSKDNYDSPEFPL